MGQKNISDPFKEAQEQLVRHAEQVAQNQAHTDTTPTATNPGEKRLSDHYRTRRSQTEVFGWLGTIISATGSGTALHHILQPHVDYNTAMLSALGGGASIAVALGRPTYKIAAFYKRKYDEQTEKEIVDKR